MSTEKMPAGAIAGIHENGGFSTPQCTTALDLETTFLRSLFGINAQHVLSAITGLEKADVYAEQHRMILNALSHRAQQQVDARDGHRPVDPVLVQLDLRQAGALAQDTVKSALIAVTTGDPAPPSAVVHLVTGLRLARLRRACITAGEGLTQAGNAGGDADLARALKCLPQLLDVARRAGIDPEEVQR